MRTTRNAELLSLTDDQLQAVTGGETIYNAYYDVPSGRYVLVPDGQVYAGSGLLVGQARLNS
jgi:hypothetical protein